MKKLLLTIAAAVTTLIAGSGTAWADTEVMDGSSITNKYDLVGTSYTLGSSYHQGASSNLYYGDQKTVKLVTTTSEFTINVNAGYIITKISAVVRANDKENSITSISVDGVVVDSHEYKVKGKPTEVKTQDDTTQIELKNINAKSSIKFTCSTQKQVAFGATIEYSVAPTSYTIPITSAGAATLSLPSAVTIPTGVKAYKGTLSEDNTKLTLTEISGTLPAEEPVILIGDEGSYTFDVAETAGEKDAANALRANLTEGTPATQDGYVNCILNVVDGQLTFRKLGDDKTLGAQKAYLPVPVTSSGAPAIRVEMGDAEGNITAIESVTADDTPGAPVYNLAGQLQSGRLTPGLYIRGGKKILVK